MFGYSTWDAAKVVARNRVAWKQAQGAIMKTMMTTMMMMMTTTMA